MAGITATQGSTIVNSDGTASFSVPQTGCVTGMEITFTLTGASHAQYAWSAAVPEGAGNSLSSTTASAPTLDPDQAGTWTIILQGKDSGGNVQATYMLPLDVPKVVQSVPTGPLALAYVAPTTVATPGLGAVLFRDATKAGAISAKDASAATTQVALVRSGATGARPATANLSVGYPFFDTSLAAGAGKPIWWDGTNWVDATGATV
jgi:hypothetical protein